MRTVAALAVLALLVGPSSSWAQTPAPQKVDIARLMPKDKPFFTGSADRWEATYKSKNRPTIVVSILGLRSGADEMVLFQTSLGTREDVPLSRNLAVKLLELSGDWDIAKVVLYDDYIAVRIDHPIQGLDATRLEALSDAVAAAAELALSEIKNYLP